MNSCIRPFPLLACGAAHFAVDAACGALVFGLGHSTTDYVLLAICYNAIAFALQPLFALLADKLRQPAALALTGTLLTALGIAISPAKPVAAVCLAGVGNALFHLGGGTISLTMDPGRAGAVGLFVAPGALGLAIGSILGARGMIPVLPFVCLLAIAGAGFLFVKYQPTAPARKYRPDPVRFPLLAVSLLLAAIAVRSLAGFAAGESWTGHREVIFMIAFAAFAGKAAGGLIADRYGRLQTVTTALLIATPLLVLGSLHPALALAGMALFQMAMPVTLACLFRLFPERPAFAFGLNCLALIIGAAPFFTEAKYALGSPKVIALLAVGTTGLLYAALRLFPGERRRIPAFFAEASPVAERSFP